MKIQHTKGPWKIEKCVQVQYHKHSSVGNIFRSKYDEDFRYRIVGDHFDPCMIFSDGTKNRGTSTANAKLISAAPDMLAALKSIPNTNCGHQYPHLEACWCCIVKAAIAKAEGDQK